MASKNSSTFSVLGSDLAIKGDIKALFGYIHAPDGLQNFNLRVSTLLLELRLTLLK